MHVACKLDMHKSILPDVSLVHDLVMVRIRMYKVELRL